MRYVLTAVLCFVATSARAEWYHIPIRTGGVFSVSSNSFDTQYGVYAGAADLDLEVNFDWDANTIEYGNFWLEDSNGTWFIKRRTYTTGPGQMDVVELRVDIDPFRIESFTSTTGIIVPTEGRAYTIVSPAHSFGTPLTLTGTWTATGPTETTTGPFSVSMGNWSAAHYQRMLTATYPEYIRMQGEASANWNGGSNIVNTVVDGYPVDLALNAVSYNMRYPDAYPLGMMTPEPSTLVLLLIGLSVAVAHRISCRRVQSSRL